MTRRPALLASAALVIGLLPALAGAAGAAPVEPAPRPVQPTSEDDLVARGVIVSTTASDASLRRAVQSAAGTELDVRPPSDVTGSLTAVDFGEAVDYADAAEVAAEVAQRPDVEWAIPNVRMKALAAAPNRPNDPRFDRQVQLWDASAKAAGGYSTKAPSAWRATTGEGATVAVVDTGVRPDHPDLAGRLLPGRDFVGPDRDAFGGRPVPGAFYGANDGDGWDADASDPGDWYVESESYRCAGYPDLGDVPGDDGEDYVEDSSWHGSHVAGIVAAERGNGTGISGVAPGVRIQPVRVLGRCGGWTDEILAGMAWASGLRVDGVPANPAPADVVNLSLGMTVPDKEFVADLCQAYGKIARDALASGTVTVAAAGNDFGKEADYSVPAACPNVVSVAATNRAGRAAFYTSTGRTVDVAAYGGDVLVEKRGVLSTVDTGKEGPRGPGYVEYDGTSMAAPAVSAAAAMLIAQGVPARQVETELKKATQPFARHSAKARSTKVRLQLDDGESFTLKRDTNCTTKLCGAGILDLSRLRVALTVTGLPQKTVHGTDAMVRVKAVTRAGSRPWGGPVELRRGSTVLARGTLDSSGSATLTLRGHRWDVGRNTIRAVLPDGSWVSGTTTVTVSKARSTVAQEVASSIDPSTRATLVATVAAPGVPAPTGTVTVYDGKKKIASASLATSHAGQVSIRLPKLAKGKHTLKTVYAGSKKVGGSTSPKQVVVAEKPVVVAG